MITDFGISHLLANSNTFAGSTLMKGNTRWMSPELISIEDDEDIENAFHTKASDMWAFGMVVYVCVDVFL